MEPDELLTRDPTKPGQWTFLQSFIDGLYKNRNRGVPNSYYFVKLFRISSFSGRLKFAAQKLTPIDFNILLVIYQRNKNEAEYQIMYERQRKQVSVS